MASRRDAGDAVASLRSGGEASGPSACRITHSCLRDTTLADLTTVDELRTTLTSRPSLAPTQPFRGALALRPVTPEVAGSSPIDWDRLRTLGSQPLAD